MAELELGRPMLAPVQRAPYTPYEIHQDVFSPQECEAIIDLGLAAGVIEATLEGHDGDEVSDASIRRSAMSWIEPTDESYWIYERIATLVESVNERYQFELSGFSEDLQFTIYDSVGSFYGWHQDGLDGDLSTRKISVVVQLSDPATYRGAELQLFEVVEDYDEGQLIDYSTASSFQGAATVFPSWEHHRVLPLRSGLRYSLVCWVSGPPFR